MKKIATFLISATLLAISVNLYAQNPNCEWEENPDGMLRNLIENSISSNENSCAFRFVMWNPYGFGWNTGSGIEITVDGVSYGTVTGIPWGQGNYFKEDTVFLSSGEVQFFWRGPYSSPMICFRIYNSSNELIYENPEDLNDDLLLTYQNECPECLPLTGFVGEYIKETKLVNLSWVAPESENLTGFNIYRNDELLEQVASTIVSYSDNTENFEEGNYKYCVLPVYPYLCTFEDECYETYINNVGIDIYSSTLSVYPNPATNLLNISGDLVVEVKIYNNMGQLILMQHHTNTINVSGLPNGIYLLHVETSTGNTLQKKITINR